MALLSVIIPVYNAEGTLGACLESVLASPVEELEVVCVDDGSTDASRAVLESWSQKDARVRFASQANGGPSRARNTALGMVQGDWVTFVDADDTVAPSLLPALCAAAASTGADCVVAGWTRCSPEGEARKAPVTDVLCVREASPAVLAGLPYQMCSRLYTADALRRSDARFMTTRMRYGEDTVFHFSVYPWCRRVALVPECGYMYAANPASLSAHCSETVLDMLEGAEFLAGRLALPGAVTDAKELLLRYCAHAMRRVRSMAPHRRQREAAGRMRRTLQAAGVAEADLACLRRKDARAMRSLLRGGSGLGAGYYWRKAMRFLRRKG